MNYPAYGIIMFNLALQPLPAHDNTKLIFKDETVGTNIPKPLVPSVEKVLLASIFCVQFCILFLYH